MDDSLRYQFFDVMMRFKKTENVFSSECDMQMNELAILQSITGNCECYECSSTNLNVPDIQEKLQITKPAVSYILNTLEKKNYINREIDSKDRRKISITPTPQGKEAAGQAAERYIELWDMLMAKFGEDDMRHLVQLLSRLMDIFKELQDANE